VDLGQVTPSLNPVLGGLPLSAQTACPGNTYQQTMDENVYDP